MASISGATSSLGNTALRGYGGLASGIDRDSIIENMTAGTNAKITKQKNAMTSLSWKQEAFQSISSKMLDIQDNFLSYSSGFNLKDASVFAKNRISVLGDKDVTKFVTATGTSNMIGALSVLGVKQTATQATRMSDKKVSDDYISAKNITESTLNDPDACQTSDLKGRQLTFGIYNEVKGGYDKTATFQFPSTYKDDSGKTQEIDYTDIYDQYGNVDSTKLDALADKMNKALKQSNLKIGDDSLSDVFEFSFDSGNNFKINTKSGHEDTNIVLRDNSSALTALGYQKPSGADTSKGISLKASGNFFNDNSSDYVDKSIKRQSMAEYLQGKKMSFTFGGQTKEVELVKNGETFADLDALAATMNERLKKAFGTYSDSASGTVSNNVEAVVNASGGLEFKVADSSQTLTINNNDPEVRNMLGILNGASNKISADASIWENRDKLGITKADGSAFADGEKADFEQYLADKGSFVEINGTKINITADTTINGLIDKINSNKDVGVKASYISSTNQFVLVADETGARGEIDLGISGLGEALFGMTASGGGTSQDGKNAEILVSYGNGINTMIESQSNTFNLEGLKVTVTEKFGNVGGTEGNWTSDRSQAVTFSASADVDGVTEKVKKFIEAYNEMVKEINTQVTTKPDKSYGPLTDEQKDEMSETSIENWEKKAKQGLLFNDATMRELSISIQGVLTNLMADGVSYEDLEEMGISISDDYTSGGVITFDESKFRDAMTNDPEKVSDIFTGAGNGTKGLANIVEDTLTPYANRFPTKYGGTYGRLIEEAGSEKLPLSISDNQIYKQLKDMEETIEKLKSQLKTEQDRYIKQFTTMETMINQMNSQANYLNNLQA